MRTGQQLYEEAVKHLRKQGQKSFVPLSRAAVSSTEETVSEYSCRYRDLDGNKCPIGCLIPDVEYKPEMEGNDLIDLFTKKLLSSERQIEFAKSMPILLALQRIHDRKPIAEWEKQFRMLADDFKLKYPKP